MASGVITLTCCIARAARLSWTKWYAYAICSAFLFVIVTNLRTLRQMFARCSGVLSGRAARAAHGDQAQQRDGATERHSEYGENEEGARTQGDFMICCPAFNDKSTDERSMM
jgi:hypothetical protein